MVMGIARVTALGVALCAIASPFNASAQPSPVDPSAQPPGTPGSPPPDPAAPPPDPAAPPSTDPVPPPAAPTSPAEPAPMQPSPMVAEQPPPVVSPPPPPAADQPEDSGKDRSAGPFARGSIRLTLLIGTASTVDDNYLIVGGGLGYFIANGLEVGLDYEAWIFSEPVIHRLSPETRYVFHMVPVIKPYVGVFYRRTFVTGGFDDFNQVGARGGLYYVPKGGGVFVGGGAVYDRLLDCDDDSFIECDSVYPEIFFGISI